MNSPEDYVEMFMLVDGIEETLLDILDSMRQLANTARRMQIITHTPEEALLVASTIKDLSIQATRWGRLAADLTDEIRIYSEALARDLEKEDSTL